MSWAPEWSSHKVGLDRLADLPAEPPQCAARRSSEPLPGKDFVRSLREHACRQVKDRYLEDRKALWDQDVASILTKPDWMTLSQENLMCWQKLMQDDLDIDHRAGVQWATLVKMGPRGQAEAARILHHLFKDHWDAWKSSDRSPSQWLFQAASEALDAIDNPEIWECGPGGQKGPQKDGYEWDKGSSSKGTPADWGHQRWGSSSTSFGQKGLKGTGRGIR